MNYFLWINGQEHGPHTLAAIHQSIEDGMIDAQQTVRAENSSEWKPINEIARPKHPMPPQTPQKMQAIPVAPPAPSAGVDTATQKRVKKHLAFIRANTCYSTLRLFIDICFAVTLLSIIGFSIFKFTAPPPDERSFFVFGAVLLYGVPLFAARQAALLFVDIADTLLIEHANNRKE